MAASYLPHLDGIRAIALAGVLLFHFDVHPFQGGYVGVDIFLTLSGYLITRNIGIALHSKSGFSIRNFYVRRFFRLYPASLVCTLVSALLAVAMFPADLALQTFKSALASLASAANIYFYLTTGYFDLTARHKPLLHHWSLSLEEQFYVVWPPLLMLVVQCVPRLQTRILTGTLTMLTITSFACAVALSQRFSSFTFFMLPTRIFQFAVGALYAVIYWPTTTSRKTVASSSSARTIAAPDLDNDISVLPTSISEQASLSPLSFFRALLNAFSALQRSVMVRAVFTELSLLFAIVVVVVSYTKLPLGAPPQHVTPVALATLVLIALPDTVFSKRILSCSALSLIGRLSYSAYLVHWPIYVFLKFAAPALHLSPPTAIEYILVTFVCALLLHHGVEQPFRRPRLLHRFFVFLLLGLTIVLCRKGIQERGFSSRLQDYYKTGFPAAIRKDNFRLLGGGVDVTKKLTSRRMGTIMRVGAVKNGTRSNFVFFGDSFTDQLRIGLNVVGKLRNVWFQIHSAPGCRFWPDYYHAQGKRAYGICRKPNQVLWHELSKIPPGSTIMFGNLWCSVSMDEFKTMVPEMNEMVKNMGGHKLVVIGDPPGMAKKELSYFSCAVFWQLPIGRYLTPVMKSLTHGRFKARADGTACADIRKGLPPEECRSGRQDEMRMFLQKKRIGFVDVFAALCGAGKKDWSKGATCKLPVYFEDRRLYAVGYYYDGSHYAFAGSYYVGVNILDKFMFGSTSKT